MEAPQPYSGYRNNAPQTATLGNLAYELRMLEVWSKVL